MTSLQDLINLLLFTATVILVSKYMLDEKYTFNDFDLYYSDILSPILMLVYYSRTCSRLNKLNVFDSMGRIFVQNTFLKRILFIPLLLSHYMLSHYYYGILVFLGIVSLYNIPGLCNP